MSQEHLHTWESRQSSSRIMWGCWSLSQTPPGDVLGVLGPSSDEMVVPYWRINQLLRICQRFGTNGFMLHDQIFQAWYWNLQQHLKNIWYIDVWNVLAGFFLLCSVFNHFNGFDMMRASLLRRNKDDAICIATWQVVSGWSHPSLSLTVS